MSADPIVVAGAKQIVQRCLGLSKGQNLLIFADETTSDLSAILAESAEDVAVQATIIFVPVSLQRRIPTEIDLSLLAQGAAREARAILTCVNSSPDCLAFRNHILETQWSARTRIGHMPGANLNVLTLANVDFNTLIAECHAIETALARGRTLEFLSQAYSGTEYRLTVNIGGWDRLPVASDGVISDGVWGNVPSGETYIAPIEGTAEGSIVINGSIPGMPIKPGEEIVIHFENGRIASIESESSHIVHYLQDTQIKRALDAGDENWRNLAEIGIGLNPAVDQLTGNMLFDEKAEGTAHIALGSNSYMGGRVDSVIHCDMVVRSPTILVDGKAIIQKGGVRFVKSEWCEDYARVSLAESPLQTATFIARSGTESSSQNQLLARVLRPEPGRVSTCYVGDEQTSRLAHGLYSQLPKGSEWFEIENLSTVDGQDLQDVRRLLHLLWEYGLINYR